MPGYKGHLLGSSLLFLGICWAFSLFSSSAIVLFEWFCCCLLGSLFPDIDTKSKGQLIFYRTLAIILCIFLWQRKHLIAAVLGIMGVIPLIGRHRGLLHTYWFSMLITCLFFILVLFYAPKYSSYVMSDLVFFVIGIYSHLFLDFQLKKIVKFSR